MGLGLGVQAFENAVRVLQEHASRRLASLPEFVPLKPGEPGTVVAVDGSNAVLVDNGAVWVVAHRAQTLTWPGPTVAAEPVVTACTPEQAVQLAGHTLFGADGLASALRDRAERRALAETVAKAPHGALVLADGALRGLPPEIQRDVDPILAAAKARGVVLVGVSKRSSLERDGVPLVSALHAAGPPGIWAVEVSEGIFVARLHAQAPCAFRVDADSVADVGRLVDLCRDAAYVGYPYPLAKVHNQVAFTGGVVSDLRAGLERALRRAGASEALRLVADFHDTLDRNVAA